MPTLTESIASYGQTAQSLGQTASGILSALNPAPQTTVQTVAAPAPQTNWMPWAIGGAIVVVVLVVLGIFTRK